MNREKREKVLFPDECYVIQNRNTRIADTCFRNFRAFSGSAKEHYNEQDL